MAKKKILEQNRPESGATQWSTSKHYQHDKYHCTENTLGLFICKHGAKSKDICV